MTTAAWIMMLVTEGVVALFTFYFLVKVVRTPPKSEPDSYSREPGNVTETPF